MFEWFAYTDDPKEMNAIAKLKLISGQQGSYTPTNEDHVFAALSFRLSLDRCLHNSQGNPAYKNCGEFVQEGSLFPKMKKREP